MSDAPNLDRATAGAHPDPSTVIGSITGDVITGDKILGDQIIHQHHADQRYDVQGLPSPFLGLSSFTANDRARYAGREQEIITALDLLVTPGEEHPLLMITGASGSGKSSFAYAGVLPTLEEHYSQRGCWLRTATFRPSKHPLAGLRDALAQLGLRPPDTQLTPALLTSILRDQTPAEQMNLVLIDQFEELYTQSQPAEREELLLLLERLPPVKESRTHWLLTMRADFLGEIFSRPALYQLAKSGLELRAMDEAALQRAIVKPVQLLYPNGEKQLEPALVEALARDTAQDASYLPLLQMTLYALWAGGSLRLASYSTLSAVLETWGDDVVQWNDYAGGKTYPRPTEHQAQIWSILLALVDVGDNATQRDVRRRRIRAELTEGDPTIERLIADLATARLLSTGVEMREGGEVQTVDLSHEALLHPEHGWQALRSAVNAQRQLLLRRSRFEELLANWLAADEATRPQLLLHGLYLEEALALRSAEDIATRSPAAAALIDASVAAREHDHQQELAQARALADEQARRADSEHRRTQLLRRAAAGLILLLGIALVAMFVALTESNLATKEAHTRATAEAVAQQERAKAETAADNAEYEAEQAKLHENEAVSQRLAFLAQDQLTKAPETARLLIYEAVKLDKNSASESMLHASLTDWNAIPLNGHTETVFNGVFSPDGQYILTASTDTTARLWTSDGKPSTIFTHTSPLADVHFSPTGQHFLTISSYEGAVRLWSIDGQQSTSIGVHDTLSQPIALFTPDGQRVLLAEYDRPVQLWDLEGRLRTTFQDLSSVSKIIFSPDQERFIALTPNGKAQMWTMDGQPGTTFTSPDTWITDAAFSPDGQQVLIVAGDLTVQLWTIDGQRTTMFDLNGVLSAIFSPNGQSILLTTIDNAASLWSITGELKFEFRDHTAGNIRAIFSPDGYYILSTADDSTARLWTIDGKTSAIFQYDSIITSMAFSPYGGQILITSVDATPHIWYIDQQARPVLQGHTAPIRSAVFSPAGERTILTASDDTTARLWSMSGQQLAVFEGHTALVTDVSFSPDGQRILTSAADGTARLWTLSGQHLITYRTNTSILVKALFSPDGRYVLTLDEKGSVHLWTPDGERLTTFTSSEPAKITTAIFSPDSQHILTGAENGLVQLWNFDKQLVRTFEGHFASISNLSFSPAGQRILTSSFDGSARLWSIDGTNLQTYTASIVPYAPVATFSAGGQLILTTDYNQVRLWGSDGRPLVLFKGHTGAVYSAQFSADAQYVLTNANDGSAKLWQSNGQLIASFDHQGSSIPQFSPDQYHIFSAPTDSTVQIHPINSEYMLAILACRVSRGLTEEELQRFQLPHQLAFNFANRQCPPALPTQK